MAGRLLLPRQQAKLARGAKDKSTPCLRHPIRDRRDRHRYRQELVPRVGHDARGAIVLRQKWSRGQVEARLANIPPCLIAWKPASAHIT